MGGFPDLGGGVARPTTDAPAPTDPPANDPFTVANTPTEPDIYYTHYQLMDNYTVDLIYNTSVGPCTNNSQLFQSSIFLTHMLNGTVNTSLDLTPLQMAESASKLEILDQEILTMGEIIVGTYNTMAEELCDPYYCRLYAAIADNSTKRFFFTPDNEATAENPSVFIRIRYDVLGFCENLDALRMQGAFIFHKAVTRQVTCFMEDFTNAFQQVENVDGTFSPPIIEEEVQPFRNTNLTFNDTNFTAASRQPG